MKISTNKKKANDLQETLTLSLSCVNFVHSHWIGWGGRTDYFFLFSTSQCESQSNASLLLNIIYEHCSCHIVTCPNTPSELQHAHTKLVASFFPFCSMVLVEHAVPLEGLATVYLSMTARSGNGKPQTFTCALLLFLKNTDDPNLHSIYAHAHFLHTVLHLSYGLCNVV